MEVEEKRRRRGGEDEEEEEEMRRRGGGGGKKREGWTKPRNPWEAKGGIWEPSRTLLLVSGERH